MKGARYVVLNLLGSTKELSYANIVESSPIASEIFDVDLIVDRRPRWIIPGEG